MDMLLRHSCYNCRAYRLERDEICDFVLVAFVCF